MMAQAQTAPATRWAQMFGLDYRSLAAARFMLGLLVVADLILRAEDLSAHYTDDGVHPREQAFGVNGFYVCLHMMNGERYFQVLLFLLHTAVALTFAFGYYTHLSAFFLWLLTSSLHARNQFILYGGYVMMRLLTVWFIFLPSGRAWSIDSVLKRDPATSGPRVRSQWHVSGFSFAYLLQMAVVYASSAWHKTGKEWRSDGTAAWYAISLDYFRWGTGNFLLGQPQMLSLLTFATLYWELYGPYLFFSPLWSQAARFVSVFGFWSLHFGLAISLRLSVFLPTFTVALVALLPAFVWDSFFIPLISTPARLRFRVQYDPSSSFATLLAQLSRLLLVPHTSITHTGGDAKDVYFKVFDHPVYINEPSLAVAAVMSHSPLLWSLAWLMRLPLVQSWFDSYALQQYEKGKHRRPSAAQRSFFKLPAVRLMRRMTAQLLGLVLALGVLTWCLGNTGNTAYATPENARPILFWLHLDQMWNLFAPRPPPGNFWYTIPAELDNGTKIELWKNSAFFNLQMEEPIDPDTYRPSPFADHFLNSRWYKWFENVNEGREDILLPFGRWICRRWNTKYNGTERLYQYKIIAIWEMNNLNGTHTRTGNNTLWWHVCYDKETPKATSENGEVIEDIKPLKEELRLEGDPEAQVEEPVIDAGEKPEESIADSVNDNESKEKVSEELPKEARAKSVKTKRQMKMEEAAAVAIENAAQLSEVEKAKRTKEREEAALRSKVRAEQDKLPFRRPIERLREIEAEDRKRRDELDKAVDGMG